MKCEKNNKVLHDFFASQFNLENHLENLLHLFSGLAFDITYPGGYESFKHMLFQNQNI